MAHDTDAIREIVADLDRLMRRVQTLTTRADIGYEASQVYDDLKQARHRLRDIGHGGRFDTPTEDTEPAA